MRTIEKNDIINAVIYDLGIMINTKTSCIDVSKYLKRKAIELEGENVRDNSNVIFISNVISNVSNVIEERN